MAGRAVGCVADVDDDRVAIAEQAEEEEEDEKKGRLNGKKSVVNGMGVAVSIERRSMEAHGLCYGDTATSCGVRH